MAWASWPRTPATNCACKPSAASGCGAATSRCEAGDWKRDKARQLFQLLLTEQGRALHREEITERLWPDRAPQAAVRDFKVALTALNKALEPQRSPDAPYAFIVREGTCYALRADADLWLDARVFEQACERGQQRLARGDQAGGSPSCAAR